MAKKTAAKYVCSACGAFSSSWTGRCNVCGEWNTIQLQVESRAEGLISGGHTLETSQIKKAAAKTEKRLTAGLGDLDVVLGGGIVPGSVVLLAGQPGIGKSTLLLQIAYKISAQAPVLYVSGEESERQIALRAQRLGVEHKNLRLATASVTNDIAATISAGKFELVIVDSVQSISVDEVGSAAGTVSQITNSTQLLSAAAKHTNTALILVGHVTKEGSIAGPKVLEHIVDVVLQLEGDRYGGFKILRGVKNRFGSTNEAAIFEMAGNGMQAVDNPSAALLEERKISDGSIVHACLEGTRPLLVEIQALVNTTSYGYPKRTASGIDLNRLNLLVAMLERRTSLKLADKDIYINVVGGIKLTERASDLAVCMAIASASRGMQLKKNAVVFGEVGLSGEIRHVPQVEKRLAEAKKMGFAGGIGPVTRMGKKPTGLAEVADIRAALNSFLEKD